MAVKKPGARYQMLAAPLAAALMAAALVDWSHEYWSVAAPQIGAWALVIVWCVLFVRAKGAPARTPRITWALLAPALGVIGLLASSGHTHHYTHAVLLGALALASLVAASFSRPSAT